MAILYTPNRHIPYPDGDQLPAGNLQLQAIAERLDDDWHKGTNAARLAAPAPSANTAGRRWFESDTGDFYIDIATAWAKVGSVNTVTQANIDASIADHADNYGLGAHIPPAGINSGLIQDGTVAIGDLAFDPATQAELDAEIAARIAAVNLKQDAATAATDAELAVEAAARAAADALLAPIASPTFTGDPKAPTPTDVDADTSLATTLFSHRSTLLDLTAMANGAPGGLSVDRIAKGTMGNTTTTIYTVPTGKRAIISSIRCRNSGTNGNISPFINGSALTDSATNGSSNINANVVTELLSQGGTGGFDKSKMPRPVILNAGDTLILKSTVGTGTPAWSYLVSGVLVPDTAPILPGRLGKGTLVGAAHTTVYTVPTGKRALILWVGVINNGTSDAVQVYANGSTANDMVEYSPTVNNGRLEDALCEGIQNPMRPLPLAASDTLRLQGVAQPWGYTIYGIEVPA
jgi:hypothetical protein